MKDKKCCENCGLIYCDNYKSGDSVCKEWTRHTGLWLDIPPEQEGWYWQRKHNCDRVLKTVHKTDRGLIVEKDFDWTTVNAIGGQWQGPITPEKKRGYGVKLDATVWHKKAT